MEKVPPQERFSQNEKANDLPSGFLVKAIQQFGIEPETCSTRRLSGGFMNANFLVDHRGELRVFRVYSSPMDVAEVERDLLQFLNGKNVLVPKVGKLIEVLGRPVLTMSYIPGVTLQEKLLQGSEVPASAYRKIGEQLAHIHSITFSEMGFFQPGLKIHKPFETFGELIRWFVLKVMNELLENDSSRLDPGVNKRLQKLVNEKWDLVMATEPAFQLNHCDFNPKNILVNDSCEPLAVIDWEFAQSGNGLGDLGNFFRFDYDYATGTEQALAEGYRSVKKLPENWREVARLLDLGNMASFLERKEDYEKSFRTARIVISATLERFGY